MVTKSIGRAVSKTQLARLRNRTLNPKDATRLLMEELRKVISTEEIAKASPVTPERRLLSAILNRAVLDFLGNGRDASAKAALWLFDRDSAGDEFSYEWICDNLDLNSERILSELLYQRCIKEGNLGDCTESAIIDSALEAA